VGDLRNEMRKLDQAEAERLSRLRSAKANSPPPPPTLRCDGCGIDGKDHWTADGKFIRLFSIPNEKGWGRGKVFCEFCLEQHTGLNPNGLT
jgi:hypothetical protein